jgi:CheY-like chemotaxis protein
VYLILLAEDNPGDVRLFREALNARGLAYELILAEDGDQALRLISETTTPLPKPPDVIVLDINLPKHNGDEVLRRSRSIPNWAAIPVIVLTSSESPADKTKVLQNGASLYLRKPSDLSGLAEIGGAVEAMLKAPRTPAASERK